MDCRRLHFMPFYDHLCKASLHSLRDLVRVELRAGAGTLVCQQPSLTLEAPAIAGQRGVCAADGKE
jgi:hypothetical protein